MQAGASARAPLGAERLEALVLVGLALVVLAVWLVQWQPFLLPNNDYYSFERVARSFAAGELPGSFKRMPIFPAAMALLAPWMGGPHAYLQAALVLNAAFSFGVLALLFRFAADTLGRGALLVPLLFASSIQFHAMGEQPLVEPSLGFFVVLAFVLHRRRSAWKWLAAFAAGLSRYEAAMVIPVLFVSDVVEQRRLLRPVLAAALASSGVVVWTLLGTLQGAGGGWYLTLMEGMGFQPAPAFLLRQLAEPFAGWWLPRAIGVPIALVTLGAPLAFGVVEALRSFRRDALALLAFWVLCSVVIVFFGVDKARYVYPTQWIPILFWTLGVLRAMPLAAGWLEARPPALRRAAAALAALLALAAAALWVGRLLTQPRLDAPWPELVLLAAGVAATVLVLWRLPLPASASAGARAAVRLGAALALGVAVAGGLAGRQRELASIYWKNASSWVVAPWLEAHLGPDDRAVVLSGSHIQFLTGMPGERMLPFSSFDVDDARALAAAMRERGATWAVWTHRGEIENPSHRFYYRQKRQDLAELFKDGGPVPGFVHVATLRVPEAADETDVQIYALAEPSSGG